MPIVAPELPPGAVDAIRRALVATERFPRARGAALSLTVPHPVFTAGLEPLAGGRPLAEAAEHTGWRVLLEEDRSVVAAADVPAFAGDRIPAGATINRGALVDSTVQALGIAERDERVAGERFVARLLRVPALYVTALWLHAADADRDIFIPLAPVPPPLDAGVPYDSGRLRAELEAMAKPVLSAYQAADRPDMLGS